MLRRVTVVAVALLAFVGGPGLVRASAGQDLTAMTNTDRVSRSLKALSTAGDLQSFAQQRAEEMARTGKLAHTTNLGSKVSNWQRLGENVGRGPNLNDIETAFMNSPSHRENILDTNYTQLGVGTAFDGKDYFYVAVLFRLPSGTASPAAQPAPKTAAAPRPAPKPAAPKPAPKPATTTTQAPTTTTSEAPTTTTTAAPPPVEQVAPPVEAPPPPVETTTTTARPITENLEFLAANFSDRMVPVPAPAPAEDGTRLAVLLAGVFALLLSGGAHAALRPRILAAQGALDGPRA